LDDFEAWRTEADEAIAFDLPNLNADSYISNIELINKQNEVIGKLQSIISYQIDYADKLEGAVAGHYDYNYHKEMGRSLLKVNQYGVPLFETRTTGHVFPDNGIVASVKQRIETMISDKADTV